jgi:hypothetical protein
MKIKKEFKIFLKYKQNFYRLILIVDVQDWRKSISGMISAPEFNNIIVFIENIAQRYIFCIENCMK